jgi:hypothetical protein
LGTVADLVGAFTGAGGGGQRPVPIGPFQTTVS